MELPKTGSFVKEEIVDGSLSIGQYYQPNLLLPFPDLWKRQETLTGLCAAWRREVKISSTSPRITLEDGQKWSLSHSYLRGSAAVWNEHPNDGAAMINYHVDNPPGHAVCALAFGSLSYVDVSGFTGITGPFVGWSMYTTNVPDDLEAQVINGLLKKLSNSDLNMGMFALESGKSAKMVAKRVIQLVKAVKALKSLKFSKFLSILGLKRHKGAFAETPQGVWLEYQYGWKPLVSDLYKMANLSFEKMTRANERNLVTVRSGADRGEPIDVAYSYLAKGSTRITLRGRAVYRMTNPALRSMQSLGLTNPLELAWELLPYSFVVDWMLPIGDYLRALSADHGLSYVDGSFTVKVKTDVKFTGVWNWYIGSGVLVRDNSGYALSLSVFERRYLPWWKMRPTLGVKNPFTETHVTNAIALLAQRLR